MQPFNNVDLCVLELAENNNNGSVEPWNEDLEHLLAFHTTEGSSVRR